MYKTIFTLVAFLLIFSACSCKKELVKQSGEEEKKYNTEKAALLASDIKFNKVYSWVNLMPNPKGETTFHISGEVELLESESYDIDKMIMTEIIIYQDNKKIYSIEPEVREDENLSTENTRFLIFSNSKKIEEDKNLDREKSIDANFVFKYGSDKYSYLVKDIKINKAY